MFSLETLYKIPASVPDSEVLARMDAEAVSLGVPAAMWSTLRMGAIAQYRVSETIVRVYQTDGPFNRKELDEEHRALLPPKTLGTLDRSLMGQVNSKYCITGCEPWWKGEPHFVVNDAYTFAQSLLYPDLRYDPALRVWEPPKGRGRKHKGPSELYTSWLEYVRESKQAKEHRMEAMRLEIKAAQQALHNLRAEPLLTFDQYKANHEG